MAKTTKSDFIRRYPNEAPSTIIALGKRAGIKITHSLICQARDNDRKRAAKRERAEVTLLEPPRLARRDDSDEIVRAFTVITVRLGIDRARALLDEIEARLAHEVA